MPKFLLCVAFTIETVMPRSIILTFVWQFFSSHNMRNIVPTHTLLIDFQQMMMTLFIKTLIWGCCSFIQNTLNTVHIYGKPLALASEVGKCTSVDALDEGSISCVCLGLMKLVFHRYSAPLSSTQ